MLDAIFELSSAVRYVALRRGGELLSRQRAGLAEASAAESDRYEELIVNPTLLTLLRSRGDIDCGGMDWVLIRYGNFFEYVRPVSGGHLSVGLEPTSQPLAVIQLIESALPQLGLAG